LQHPAIPPVHEIGRLDDGRPFFAMKLIEGRTLEHLLRDRPSPAHDLPRFVAVFGQVCQALAYAHSQGVLHRDLKPQNVMVGAFGEVQVMDWGLAKILRDDSSDSVALIELDSGDDPFETHYGDIVGTVAYMAPEQARGEPVDERADVYALGGIL